eukprot:2757885-Pleurochrysis_carterae.AAC.3
MSFQKNTSYHAQQHDGCCDALARRSARRATARFRLRRSIQMIALTYLYFGLVATRAGMGLGQVEID